MHKISNWMSMLYDKQGVPKVRSSKFMLHNF